MHTRWSDGSGTIAQMKNAATERGYEYIAITDHSKGLKIAGGIDERALQKQFQVPDLALVKGPGRKVREVRRQPGCSFSGHVYLRLAPAIPLARGLGPRRPPRQA